METSHTLAIESFSYSWLSNVTSLENSHESTSIEFDYKIVNEAQNFDFDIPMSPVALLHADELFSDGLIKPVSVDHHPSKIDASATSDFITILPGSSFSVRNIGISAIEDRFHFFIKWRKSSKRIFQKCFGCLRSFCHKVIIRSSRKSSRITDIDRRVGWEVKSWSNSPQASPQRSTAYSVNDWYAIESSIREAILHCKRSIEK